MIHTGKVPTAESQSCFRVRRAVSSGALTLAAVLAVLMSTPAPAQTPAQAASGSGQRSEPVVNKKDTPSGPAKAARATRGSHRATKVMMAPSRVVLVFPTDSKGGVSDQLADVISETIQGRIAASGRYQTVYFLRSLPTVQRAINEATLTANEVSHPFDDDTKLRKLIPYTSYDLALTTSIDSYTYDSAKNQVTLLISARLIDYRGEKPIVRAAAENGSSPESSGNAREIVLASTVAKSITEKLMTSLLAQDKSMQAPTGTAPASGSAGK